MTSELRLLEYRLAVPQHLEATATRRDHIDLRARERLSNLGRQTGGPRLVASDGAVLDRDRHRRTGEGERFRQAPDAGRNLTSDVAQEKPATG
jgi:hypothetical protein